LRVPITHCFIARMQSIRQSVQNGQFPNLIVTSWRLVNLHVRLNSLIGMRSYEQVRRILSKATQELTILDTLPD